MTSRTSPSKVSTPLVEDLPRLELELELECDEQDAGYLEDDEYDEEVCMKVDADAGLSVRRNLFGGLLGEDLNRRLQTGLDKFDGRSQSLCVLGHRLWMRYVDVCFLHKSRLFVLIWGASTSNAAHEA